MDRIYVNGMLLFALVAAVALSEALSSAVGLVTFLLGLGPVGMVAYRSLRTGLEIGSDGIWVRGLLKSRTFIPWADVANFEVRPMAVSVTPPVKARLVSGKLVWTRLTQGRNMRVVTYNPVTRGILDRQKTRDVLSLLRHELLNVRATHIPTVPDLASPGAAATPHRGSSVAG